VNDVCVVTVFRLKIEFRGKKFIAEMYAAAEYIEIIVIYGVCGRNAREAARISGFPIVQILEVPQETYEW
jgi:hypothetical protein